MRVPNLEISLTAENTPKQSPEDSYSKRKIPKYALTKHVRPTKKHIGIASMTVECTIMRRHKRVNRAMSISRAYTIRLSFPAKKIDGIGEPQSSGWARPAGIPSSIGRGMACSEFAFRLHLVYRNHIRIPQGGCELSTQLPLISVLYQLDFLSLNFHHCGAPKIWYSVPLEQVERFEQAMR